MRKLLSVLGLAGVAGILVKNVARLKEVMEYAGANGRNHEDAGGASPGEAIADEAAKPHAPTTPSHPAEVVEIKPQK